MACLFESVRIDANDPSHPENQKMPRTLFRRSLSIMFIFATVVPVFAWHDAGHKLTGYIAWQRMTPQAREAAVRILRAAPEDSQIAALYSIYGFQPIDVKILRELAGTT